MWWRSMRALSALHHRNVTQQVSPMQAAATMSSHPHRSSLLPWFLVVAPALLTLGHWLATFTD